MLKEAGYALAYDPGEEAFAIFVKDGCQPVPVNREWSSVRDGDPISRCLQRDLGLSRADLRTRLNQARRH